MLVLSSPQSGAVKKWICTTLVSYANFFCRGRLLTLVFSNALRYQFHMSDDSIQNLARKLAESVPEGLR